MGWGGVGWGGGGWGGWGGVGWGGLRWGGVGWGGVGGRVVVVVALLFYVHSKHLWSCRDGQLT